VHLILLEDRFLHIQVKRPLSLTALALVRFHHFVAAGLWHARNRSTQRALEGCLVDLWFRFRQLRHLSFDTEFLADLLRAVLVDVDRARVLKIFNADVRPREIDVCREVVLCEGLLEVPADQLGLAEIVVREVHVEPVEVSPIDVE